MTDGCHKIAFSAERFHAELSEVQVVHPLKPKLVIIYFLFLCEKKMLLLFSNISFYFGDIQVYKMCKSAKK